MKKFLLAGILLPLLFWSCKKDKGVDYSALIPGRWVNTLINNAAILTDASFVLEFRTDNIETYASGYTLDSNNKSWIDNNKFAYSVSGNKIIIDGSNNFGNHFYMEFDIESVDNQVLRYSVSKFMVDNVEYPDPKIYTNKKITADFSAQLSGTWYGRSTTPGSADTSYHYWQYFPDGKFNYYYRDDMGNWINKPDNAGKYYLYGDLLATNYTNDLLSGGTGNAYECWNFSITGDTMHWTAQREFGLFTSFRMEKVAGPPIIPLSLGVAVIR